jgi:uncharacterized protein (UPF0276 family)
MQINSSYLGFGLGLRPVHYPYIFEHQPKIDWFEVISENFMDTDGMPRRNLARIAEIYPIVMHGVAMSIGTIDALNSEYLSKLKKLANEIKPAWISDHLCWTGIAHKNTHDLLPVPYTEKALKHIVERISQVQDFLGRPIALENPSTYLEFKSSHIAEAEFIAEMAKRSGCQLLLDVNNIYVTCYNHRLDAKAYIDALPLEHVIQIHLSGHSNMGNHIIDTHDDYVAIEVWSLYKYVVHKAGRTPNTMVEWDDNIPAFEVLEAELAKAKQAANDAANYAPLPQLAQAENRYIANITTPLAEAQNMMQHAILQGAALTADDWILPKAEFSPTEQLQVYINAYRFRLYDVVAEDYCVLKNYLGDENFEKLLNDFVENVHSNHFNIGRYAAYLPDFIAKHELGNKFAFELTTLENAISQLADAIETTPLTPEHLQGITPEDLMQMQLSPRLALQLFAFEYPVNDYYGACKDEASPAVPSPAQTYLCVFRHDDVMWRMDLEEAEYELLCALFNGSTIGEALGDLDESIAENLSNYFSRWIRNGLLAHHEYANEQAQRNYA